MTKIPRILVCMVALGALISAGLALAAGPAGAVTVSTEAELQTAFANAAETEITLANSIDLTCGGGGDLDRNSATALTIIGNGFTIRQTCAGERVMEQIGSGSLTLDNVTVTGGTATSDGGGIAVNETVTINNSRVIGNTTTGGAGGVGANRVVVNDSTVSDNTAPNGGGGIGASSASVTGSTISGNTGVNGGGGIGAGSVTVTNSTLSGNSAPSGGGGAVGTGTLTVTNSTIAGNSAAVSGGAIGAGLITLLYVTVVQNSAPTAANVDSNNSLESFGSVVALPQGGGANCELNSATVSNGYNFSDDTSCGFTASTDRQNAGDPGLAALASNGGPTQTRLPLAGSPLIDAIPDASCGFGGITTDQRGVGRPQGPGCDIGAVEVQPPAPGPGPGPAPAAPVTAAPRFTG